MNKKPKGMVKINLLSVLFSLQQLSDNVDALNSQGNPFDMHYFLAPKNMPVDYVTVAKRAIEKLKELSSDHPSRHDLNQEKVERGYELLESKKVPIAYLGPEISFTEV